MSKKGPSVVIVGGGIGGLTLALALHKVGIACHIYEAAPELKPLGVGINLLPHAVKELTNLDLLGDLLANGIETRDVSFYTSNGQLVYREDRGKYAGYSVPQVSIHRGALHSILLNKVVERLGQNAISLDKKCVSVSQRGSSASASFIDSNGRTYDVSADLVIGCDGVHSVIRRSLYPNDTAYHFHGTVQYRGTTRWTPFLSGRSMAYVGTPKTGKLVVYPIGQFDDGLQLTNWVLEVARDNCGERDWNRRANVSEFISLFEDWHFDWLDVPALLSAADSVYEYPLVDQAPLSAWTVGHITLLGDAAHPMLPRGSNGAAQAIIDATTLAGLLSASSSIPSALLQYDNLRVPATRKVVLTNRDRSPDAILGVVEERTGGAAFENIDHIISPDEMREWHASYKAIAGFSADRV